MVDLASQRLTAPVISLTPRLALRDFKGITKRNLLRIIRTPQLLFMSVVQPTIILLLFRYVLGGAISVPGVDYVDYVVPGIFLEAVLIGGMTTALALAQDLQAGMIRPLSQPSHGSLGLPGRPHPGRSMPERFRLALHHWPRAAGRVPLPQRRRCLPGGHRPDHLLRLFVHLGLRLGRAGSERIPRPLRWPLSFRCSSSSSPAPRWFPWPPCQVGFQPFARNQPATVVIDSVHALFEGGPLFHNLWQALAWCSGILVVFFVVSLNLYRRATA